MIELLQQQFAWLRRSGNSNSSQEIFRVINWAKQFSDFRGMVAAYSGNKSLHFHFIFDTSDLMVDCADIRDSFRAIYQTAFERLSTEFEKLLPIGMNHDVTMRQPEQFRRLPNGTSFAKSGQLFGLPERTEFPQVTLFEHLLSKAPNNSNRLFFEPNEVRRQVKVEASVAPTNPTTNQKLLKDWVCEDERLFCFDQLEKLIAKHRGSEAYPKLINLVIDGQIKAYLLANEFDQNPNVLLFGNSSTPIVAGGKRPTTIVNIGIPLKYHIKAWRRTWSRQNPDASRLMDETEVPVAAPFITPQREQASRVSGPIGDVIATELDQRLENCDVLLMRAPDGSGKTTAAMRLIPTLAQTANQKILGKLGEFEPDFRRKLIKERFSMVATATYDQAVEKCAQFNRTTDKSVATGIQVYSFDMAYQFALTEIYGEEGVNEKINVSVAAKGGFKSVIRAIRTTQPDVYNALARFHKKMTDPIKEQRGQKHIVLFAVHDVMHQWSEGGLTSLFVHPDFFQTEVENLWALKDETRLVVAVHDELDCSQFMFIEPLEKVKWCEALFETGKPWHEDSLDLGEAYKSWSAKADQQVGSVEFSDVIRINRSGLTSEDNVGVGCIERYGYDNRKKSSWPMYEQRHTHRYAVRCRNWWGELADKTILLTTEALPTAIFEVSDHSARRVSIYDGREQIAHAGRIEAHIFDTLKSSDNPEIIQQMRESLDMPDLHAVCHNCSNDENSTSIPKAKGSNELTNRDIIQIVNFISPAEGDGQSQYDLLQVINQKYGLDTALKLHHVDQINQIAGRNLGYRYTGNRHILVISRSLWNLLKSQFQAEIRYSVDVIQDAKTRRNTKHNRNRRLNERLENEARDHYDERRDRQLEARRVMLLDAELDELADKMYAESDENLCDPVDS